MDALSTPTWGGIGSMTAVSSAINTTETILASATIPANKIKLGTTYKVTVFGTCTSSGVNACNIRVRIGTAGTSADAVAAVINSTSGLTGTNIPFTATLLVTTRTIGSAGTMGGNGFLLNNGITGITTASTGAVIGTPTSAIAVNTTVANIIQVSFISAAVTTSSTFQIAMIEIGKI